MNAEFASMKVLISLFIVLLLICLPQVNAQISPGDLCEPHAHLEGLKNCTLCHTLGKQVSDEKCLDCHKALNQRIMASKGYHVSQEVKGKRCVSCHNDHHGRSFQIIRFDEAQFDHSLTKYKLEGEHANTKCRDCHQKKNIKDEVVAEQKFTFLGLETTCLSCHEDYHQQNLTKNCLDCHDNKAFKPAPGFDHNKTKFILLGKHKETACDECHEIKQQNGRNFQKFSGLQFGNCVDCHEDVHENKFGKDCKKCHSELSFRRLNNVNTFDHSRTGYLLEGRHLIVACASCHKQAYTQTLKHGLCTDCHKDYHQGQFMVSGRTTDCSQCHTVNGFSESTYTIERHQQSSFMLNGAHLATPCFGCHQRENKWNFRQIGKYCADCHNDIHQGYIPDKYYPDASCVNCHDEQSWANIRFDHNLTSYQLEGKHREPSCRACHFPGNNTGIDQQRFAHINNHCSTCHTNNHQGQFDKDGISDCKQCHDFNNWKAEKFDHTTTAFPLEGKHALVACIDCHKTVPVAQKSYVLYKIKDFKCESCH